MLGAGLTPTLLRALELDKAVYEVLYETRSHSSWGAATRVNLVREDAAAHEARIAVIQKGGQCSTETTVSRR